MGVSSPNLMSRRIRQSLVLAACLLACALSVPAQTAQLTGRVSDASQSIIPGASVTAKSDDSGVEFRAQTNAEGYFSFTSLPPGGYEVLVSRDGFRPRKVRIELQVQQVGRLDVVLQVGAVSESVEVSARAVMLDSETSTMGQVVAAKQITELPLLGRNPYALAALVPGVRPTAGMSDVPINVYTNQFASINGSRGNQNEFLLDGLVRQQRRHPASSFPHESVRRFRRRTAGAAASL